MQKQLLIESIRTKKYGSDPFALKLKAIIEKDIDTVRTLDSEELQTILAYIREVLESKWDEFHTKLLSADFRKNYIFVACYLDICIKLFNVANRMQATLGLERPSLTPISELTIVRLVYGRDGTCSRIFYQDKTGRKNTIPIYIPMQPIWSKCMLLFLYQTRDYISNKVFTITSGDIVAFIHEHTHLPLNLFPRQHMLRYLYINNRAIQQKFDQDALVDIAHLVRHSILELQTTYNPWTRMGHSVQQEYIEFRIPHTNVNTDSVPEVWRQTLYDATHYITYEDDQYWTSEHYTPIPEFLVYGTGIHTKTKGTYVTGDPTSTTKGYTISNSRRFFVPTVAVDGTVTFSEDGVMTIYEKLPLTPFIHNNVYIESVLPIELDDIQDDDGDIPSTPIDEEILDRGIHRLAPNAIYIGIDTSPLCVAVCIATMQLISFENDMPRKYEDAVVQVSYFNNGNDTQLSSVSTFIRACIDNKTPEDINITIEAPLPSGIHVDNNQSNFTKRVQDHLKNTLKVQITTLKTKSVRKYLLGMTPTAKLIYPNLYTHRCSPINKKTAPGKRANRFILYLTLLQLGFVVNDYLESDELLVDEYVDDDDDDDVGYNKNTKIINRATKHPVSDIVDCIALTIMLQGTYLNKPLDPLKNL